ncbi:MAG TPA: enoyl-CoA hydratase-related protein [Candidatus Tectomicrobia bacterium]|nr:enoyl-CoA hydratase-related protein [Candidatus Tectomicrobia bacterium]
MAIRYDQDGKVVTITIDRPQAMNAMDRETSRELAEAFQDFDRDEQRLVAILTGAGDRAFSAGADLKKMYGRAKDGNIREIWDHERQWRLGQRLQVWKPVIAAINGYCLAGGLELAMGCDIRIASDTASFGCPEVRWGILHGYGALRLPKTVPLSAAMELLLTGERISAQDAYRLGIVSRVVAPAELMPTARQLAEKICANGPLAVRITKELAWRGLETSTEEALRLYAALGALVRASEDAREGPRAFAEKRQPRFKGR